MLIGPSQSLLQALGSSVAPPEPVRLAPTPRAASAALTSRPTPPAHGSSKPGAAPSTGAPPRETEAAPHSSPQRGSKLDIVV